MPSEEALIDLEIRVAYQEDTIAALDQQLRDQQRRIDLLEQHHRHLLARMEELLGGDGPAPSEPPPHY